MLIHLKKIRKWHLDYFCVIFFFYDCSKVFLDPFLPFDSQEKNLCPLCVSDPWKILIMTPSEGQVNDRIALDMEARESHLLMAAKKTESCSHTLTKLNIISSSFHYYDGWGIIIY